MKMLSRFLCGASMLVLVPAAVNAAGTYYTGNYQSPQTARYQSSAFSNNAAARSTAGVSGYNQARYSSAGYNTVGYNTAYANRYGQNVRTNTAARVQQSQPQIASGGNGLRVDAGLNYKTGMWQFDMNLAGSKLRYDNLTWGVFDINAAYDFYVGNSVLVLDAGLEYGMQLGESTMIDDDITNGGFWYTTWPDEDDPTIGYKGYMHSLSVGTSKDGDMLGLRAGLGLKDFFNWGRVKVTPSIGWRHLNYKLETSNNYGATIATVEGNNGCVTDGGMTQCWPAIAYFKIYNNGTSDAYVQYVFEQFEYKNITGKKDEDGNLIPEVIGIPMDTINGEYVDVPDSMYFHISDVSHSYEVTWSGPYLALDMLYDINTNNSVTARFELGLPMYNVTADQPYRPEWQHPKAIEDEAGLGKAIHFGAGAQWRTAITDKVSLSLGVTYDYYNVSGADASTYLNPTPYQEYWDALLGAYEADYGSNGLDYMLNGVPDPNDPNKLLYAPDPDAVYINQVRANGWKDTVKDEIDSFFKSLGVRVGLNIKF